MTIHAGVPKAGSSSIQSWLTENTDLLRRSHDTVVAVAREGNPITTLVHDGSGTINSAELVRTMTWDRDRRAPALNAFLGALESLCDAHKHVVVTSEAFASFLWRPDEDFVLGLENLATKRPVRVVYYVRPQHFALEAAWRQWGFRGKAPPSLFLTLRADHMEYASAYTRAQGLAPSVEFIPRAFREDLLAGGDVVADFAEHYLGVRGASHREVVNAGLPLEIVILLREAPDGMFWESMHDNARLRQIKELLSDLELPESDRIQRSRAVLQAYCHERFEPGNQELIRRLGCPITEWIPAPEDAVRGDLAELDTLWTTEASPAEREVLFSSISRALGRASPCEPGG